jgi:DNA repair protein RadC
MNTATPQALAAILGFDRDTTRAEALLHGAGTPRALLESALGRAWQGGTGSGSAHDGQPAGPRGPATGSSLTADEAASIRAAWRFIRACIRPGTRRPLKSADAVVRLVPSLGRSTHEAFWIVAVDVRLRPLLVRRVATGTPSGLAVSIAATLRLPVGVGAAGVFLLHNHPGGTPAASSDDLALTQAYARACELLGMRLHDHLIVAGERWRSCVTGASGSSWLPAVARAPLGPGDAVGAGGSCPGGADGPAERCAAQRPLAARGRTLTPQATG